MGWARTAWLRGCHFSKDLKMSAYAYRYLRGKQWWHRHSPQDRVTTLRNSMEASMAEAQREGEKTKRGGKDEDGLFHPPTAILSKLTT